MNLFFILFLFVVQHILASSFPTRCIVWDLRKNEPIIKLTDNNSRVSFYSSLSFTYILLPILSIKNEVYWHLVTFFESQYCVLQYFGFLNYIMSIFFINNPKESLSCHNILYISRLNHLHLSLPCT